MILLTGHKGFIGTNFHKFLPKESEILLVEKEDSFQFLKEFQKWNTITLVIHQGAISNTLETNEKQINSYNYEFTIELFKKFINSSTVIKYASSASVYGNSKNGYDPLNLYSKSKLDIDNWVIENIDYFNQIQGFRYFNVYGENEYSKIKLNQSSPISKFLNDAKNLTK